MCAHIYVCVHVFIPQMLAGSRISVTLPRTAHALPNGYTQLFPKCLKIHGGVGVGAYNLRFISGL